MKSEVIALSKWHTIEDNEGNLDVDWPRYHQEVGEDCLQWLFKQEKKNRCQLIIERQASRVRLSVDMFDKYMISEFYLLWSK